MECAKAIAGVRKAKKKQVKDELDRMKQAEKKKRRLEKALATSAAIRLELEKKKQKKKEEQERLYEEGAAIAEAVALHVLLGEDSDDSSKMILKKNEELTLWDEELSNYSLRYGQVWSQWGDPDFMYTSEPMGREFYARCFGGSCWGNVGLSAGHAGLSAGHVAAQAFSSLNISDDAYVFNHVLRG